MRLSPEQLRALAALLDVLVPPDAERGMPGAGELGVADALEENLRQRPELAPGLEEGLARLDRLAGQRAGCAFAQLEAAGRRAVLDETTRELPAFLGLVLLQSYLAYYRHPRVLEALGLEARPPYPKGHAVPPTDFSLLDPVRRRAPFYRRP